MAISKLTLSFKDYSDEGSSCSFHMAEINAGNLATVQGLADDISDAVANVTLGTLRKDSRLLSEAKFGDPLPTNAFAQREIKWLVQMADPNGNIVSNELPCADLALLAANSDILDVTTVSGAALVAALEAGALSNDGEALTFIRATVVGRSL